MQRLSEFVSFVSRKSGVRNVSLIENDVILHKVLSEIRSSELGEHYLFKGGSCMVKCFFGYYRFSLDLDFTWREQNVWKGLGKRGLRRELLSRSLKSQRLSRSSLTDRTAIPLGRSG